jgi:serine/threonine-protein kinase
MPLIPGARLGPYDIVAPLGAGGMGEVYRARDTRLAREVAIKVLPEHMASDADALARFEREAKAVAALSHPNILAIHDVGRENGVSFVVTELLEGQTLREHLRGSAIPWLKSVEIGIAIADGLAAAHAKGIIHRDVKPENIFITTAGHVKILDFGVARMEPEGQLSPGHTADATPTITRATRPGAILGTLNYMSPEQVRGLHTDGRSDIFSLGCVVYEMVAGRRAFAGDSPADTITAILKEEPFGITDALTGIRPELERVIVRCLEKKPEQRFQSTPDLAFTLRSILADGGTTPTEKRYRIPRPAIAVLPMENVSRDPEQDYFVDGMTEALISDLAKIGGLKVISRTSIMRYKATTKSLPEIARELNVDAVVEGSVLRVGDRVRITAQLIHAATDEHLWADSYDRDLRDVLQLHSEVARTIAQEIKVTLTPQEHARMVRAHPVNPDAYQAYLKGRFYWNKRTPDGVGKAVEYFEQVVSLDPDWPVGYAGLADAYVVMPQYSSMRSSEAMPKAQAAAKRALEIDESLAEAHATMALIANNYDWNFPTARREYERAIALSPNYATAHHWYAVYLLHMGRLDEAVKEMTKAQELDPLSLIISSVLGMAQWSAGDLAQAETGLRKTLDLGPDFAMAHMNLAITLFLQQRLADAITEARVAVRLSNNAANHAAFLGYMCAKAGNPEEARTILDELAARSKETYVAPTYLARIHAGLGETDQMFDWLERAYSERDSWLPNVLVDPLLASMHADPRFADLVRRVGLPSR